MLALMYMNKSESKKIFSAAKISEQLQIPKEFISKILQSLVLKGILISKKGRGGGFSFASNPFQIKLKPIFETLGHTKEFEKCLFGGNTNLCDDSKCIICSSWTTFNKDLTYIINNHTLGNFCSRLENDLNN
jgi:Rrf2 family protein